jgi:ATP-dependent DNA helicase RecQ
VLLEYFGEQTEWEQCGHCDNCGHPIDPPVQAATGDTHPAAADDTSQAPLRVGDRVRVPVHGMGEVQMVDGDKVELSFANGAVRRFKRRFVRPLQP